VTISERLSHCNNVINLPWNARRIEQSSVLAHIKWKCFVPVSTIPRNWLWQKSARKFFIDKD